MTKIRDQLPVNALEDVSPDVEDSKLSSITNGPISEVRYKVVAFTDLQDAEIADWRDIRSQSSYYRSPFFSYDFIRSVAGLRPGVEVAIARHSGRSVAMLPFRRVGACHARPVGAGVNDAHALLADASVDIDFDEFLRGCGLKSFAFHASPIQSPGIAKFELGRTNAFLADLTLHPEGYEHFLRSRNRTIYKQGQKTRKLAREVGPLRFEFDCRDSSMIRRLFKLKSEHYRRTHTFDILSVPWIQELLFKLHEERHFENRGLISVLYAGGQPVAMHYGMLEGEMLHYWFPTYDPIFQFGSPGTQLFLDVVQEANQRGVTAIDMGYGEQPYKHKLTNVISQMSFGVVDSNPVRRAVYRGNLALQKRLKEFRIRKRLKPIARRFMPSFGKNRYSG